MKDEGVGDWGNITGAVSSWIMNETWALYMISTVYQSYKVLIITCIISRQLTLLNIFKHV